MAILICTQLNDIHAEEVAKKIRGNDVVLLQRYELDNYITCSFKDDEVDLYIKVKGKKYSVCKDIESIYWRVKPIFFKDLNENHSHMGEQIRIQEWMEAIISIEMFIQESKTIINPIHLRNKWERKIIQLKFAGACGLNIPQTIVSNDYKEILKITSSKLIYKMLRNFFTEKGGIYTNRTNKQQISQSKEAIFFAPGIFQQMIQKAFELRVTVVGNKVFPIKVHSQIDPRTKLDWRYIQEEHIFSEGSISKQTEKNLLNFHKMTGLIYAAYDFIVTPEGEEIFLECNPSGQWLFVGKKLGSPITEAVADYLMARD